MRQLRLFHATSPQFSTLHLRWTRAAWVRASRVLVLIMAGTLAGCRTFVPDPAAPDVVAHIPESFTHTATTLPGDSLAYATAAVHWWNAFGDPVLNALVDSALVANLDLVQAVARLKEVRALRKQTQSNLFPTVSVDGTSSYSDSPANVGQAAAFSGNGQGGGPDRIAFETSTTALSVSYEVDLWGRLRNESRAANRDVLASESDLQAVRLAVVGGVIQAYFDLVMQREQLALLEETITVLAERVEQAEERYQRGLTDSFVLYQLRQDERSTVAQRPQQRSALAAAEYRLAALTGRFPDELDVLLGKQLTPRLAFDQVPIGVPADLLVQRPDVRAAAFRFEAERYRVGASRARLMPSIALNGSLGITTEGFFGGGLLNGLSDILNQWTLNLVSSTVSPIFQGGRLRAQVSASEARYEQQAAAFAASVVTAMRETSAALVDYEEQRRRYVLLIDQRDEAQANVTLLAERFGSGVAAYSEFLDAQRALYQAETALAIAARDVAVARLSVHRALGGTWTSEEAEPVLRLMQIEAPFTDQLGS
ncbi:MAG: efflux transporter outer membrane subunit [Bacteroidota bacterium]